MEFTLKYRGALPGGNASGKVEYKHAIRKAVHEQLSDLWRRDPRLNELNPDEFHVAAKSDRFAHDVPRPILGSQNFYFRVPCGGIDFIPLVIRIRYSNAISTSLGTDTTHLGRSSARTVTWITVSRPSLTHSGFPRT